MVNLFGLVFAFLVFLWLTPVRMVSSGTGAVSLAPTPSARIATAASPSPNAASDYPHPDRLVDPAWLKAHLGDAHLRVVALTPTADFAQGHIPGAARSRRS